jgi:hypothetical protein
MTNVFKNNAKYHEWTISHTFDNCKLERKDYGEFLTTYITGEHNGFVLNLNGSWGTGKTEFLKRMYSNLLEKEHPVIYIDAWESDFSKDPLTVVTSELLNQLEKFNESIGSEKTTKDVKAFCGKALKGALVGVAGFASAKLLNDSSLGMEAVKQFIEKSSEDFTDQLTKEYAEQIDAIRNIRESLGQLAEVLNTNYNAKLPAVILIDELDRCRPTYAIEMLEVIKHFFTTDNFVFVVATDTDELCHSINSVYGNNFNSAQYLKRFFDRKANIPEPDIEHYINVSNQDYAAYSSLRLFPFIVGASASQNINTIISKLASAYDLKIRDVDQLLNKIYSCLRTANSAQENTKKEQIINFPALVIGIIEQDKNLHSFNKRNNNTTNSTPAFNTKIKFSNDLDINLYIKIVMNIVVRKEYSSPHRFGDHDLEMRFPNHTDLSIFSADSSSSELRRLLESIKETLKTIDAKQEKQKYWLWDDYKKVIELAGNLE